MPPDPSASTAIAANREPRRPLASGRFPGMGRCAGPGGGHLPVSRLERHARAGQVRAGVRADEAEPLDGVDLRAARRQRGLVRIERAVDLALDGRRRRQAVPFEIPLDLLEGDREVEPDRSSLELLARPQHVAGVGDGGFGRNERPRVHLPAEALGDLPAVQAADEGSVRRACVAAGPEQVALIGGNHPFAKGVAVRPAGPLLQQIEEVMPVAGVRIGDLRRVGRQRLVGGLVRGHGAEDRRQAARARAVGKLLRDRERRPVGVQLPVRGLHARVVPVGQREGGRAQLIGQRKRFRFDAQLVGCDGTVVRGEALQDPSVRRQRPVEPGVRGLVQGHGVIGVE